VASLIGDGRAIPGGRGTALDWSETFAIAGANDAVRARSGRRIDAPKAVSRALLRHVLACMEEVQTRCCGLEQTVLGWTRVWPKGSTLVRVSRERTVCQRLGVEGLEPQPRAKLGIALTTVGRSPINGLRHAPSEGTSGWFIWCGEELSDATDFFAPLHVQHIAEYLPEVVDYLNLPPGYRFLIDGAGYEDVWFDPSLLEASAGD
jgi:hypothetical protein